MNERVAIAEAELFDDAVSCREILPASFEPGNLDDARILQLIARAEGLLRTITHIEDGAAEDADERSDPALLRLEAKVNVLLELVGGWIGRDLPMPPVRQIRWSRKGLALSQSASLPIGETGVLRLQPAGWLPLLLELPARVVSVDGDEEAGFRLSLRLDPLPETLESALERHLFRVHRRSIARRHQHKREAGD